MGNFLTLIKYRQRTTSEGFTLIEVLAGILIATTFVLITSQAIALSALYRVHAQRESEAVQWIQTKFETDIKFESLQDLTADCNATVEANGFAQALIDQVRIASSDNETPVFLNKTHDATRQLGVKSGESFNVMTVEYTITDPERNDTTVANFYTEIIPDAAFDCD